MIKNSAKRKLSCKLLLMRKGLVAVAFLIMVCNSYMAAAFEVPTKNEDISIRWDFTLKYNLGVRVESPDQDILNSVNYDDGDRNFKNGDLTTNRLDLFTEFDFLYKDMCGFRISAAGWYDQRYAGAMNNTSVLTSNTLDDNGAQTLDLNDDIEDYYKGPYGELLDAFIFSSFSLGEVPFNVRLGRHTIYWGEAFLNGINAISYSQFPIDFSKALGVPGTEVKQTFRPRTAVSLQAQLAPTLGLQLQQFFEFEPAPIPETGTYLGGIDLYLDNSDAMVLAPGAYWRHASDVEPDGTNDFGIALNWMPQFLRPVQGKFGLYYRQTSDMLGQLYTDSTTGSFFWTYADKIDLYGFSYSTSIAGTSIAFEYSFRQDQPLNSTAVDVAVEGRPDEGDTAAARGDVHFALLNFYKMFGPTSLYDMASGILEFTYCRWEDVNSGEQYFKGADGYNSIDRVTKDALGVGISYKPTWFGVFKATDISLPISFSIGLDGNSAVNSGDAKGSGSASVGIEADYKNKHNFQLAYNTYYGDHDATPTDGMTAVRGGLPSYLYDRDWISFTYKVNF